MRWDFDLQVDSLAVPFNLNPASDRRSNKRSWHIQLNDLPQQVHEIESAGSEGRQRNWVTGYYFPNFVLFLLGLDLMWKLGRE